MSESRTVRIELRWRLAGSEEWLSRTLLPEEYFEPDEEPFDLDSVPLFDHAVEYLGANREDVTSTRIALMWTHGNESRVISEAFWNAGKNRVIERVDEGDIAYWEMILESRTAERPTRIEILRLGRDETGVCIPLSHVFLEERADGSHSETKTYPPK